MTQVCSKYSHQEQETLTIDVVWVLAAMHGRVVLEVAAEPAALPEGLIVVGRGSIDGDPQWGNPHHSAAIRTVYTEVAKK